MKQSLAQLQAAVRGGNFVILDTETTGIHKGEVCEIAIINPDGLTLLHSLVKTHDPIPDDARAVHGISDVTVKDSPTWLLLQPEVAKLLTGVDVIVYNAVYDRKMLHQTGERWNMPKTEWKIIGNWICAMEAFAVHYGDWNAYRGNFKWQPLWKAAQFFNIDVVGQHSAHGDCLMTLAVCKALAALES